MSRQEVTHYNNQYNKYYLRELRYNIGLIIYNQIGYDYLMGDYFGYYIITNLFDTEIQPAFREPFKGEFPYINDYNVIFQVWAFLYSVKKNNLFYPNHYLVWRILSKVQDDVNIMDINEIIQNLFRVRQYRVRE